MWCISTVSSNSRHLAKIEANYGVSTKWKVSKLTLDEPVVANRILYFFTQGMRLDKSISWKEFQEG